MSSTPTKLGKYQIIREIARSNDIVYEGYDPQMNRRVAVKELALMKGSSGQQVQDRIDRFKREARAAGTISHPNIMTVYELGEDGDTYFIAMEFLDGHTLRNEIDTKGNISVERAKYIAIEVLKGLGFAHQHGVIHRDVKPDNIQILSDDRIKLTDFGIARLTFEPNLTLDGQVFGTPSYMSPEQIVGKEIDARSDVFSLAALLYEMVEGRKPFPGDSVIAITTAVTSQPSQPMQKAPFGLAQVIEKALEKVPSMRYANAEEMMKALEVCLSQPDYSYNQNPSLDPYGAIPSSPMGQAAGSQMYGAPINSPPPMIVTPYGGYGTSPGYNPTPQYPAGQQYPGGQQYYGGQMGSGPNPMYSYNPAQQNAYNSMYAQGYVPLQNMPPAYYPPPARRAMNPETKGFLAKLGAALLIGITAVIVIVVLIQALSKSLSHAQQIKVDQELAKKTNYAIKNLPLQNKIDQLQKAQVQIKSPLVQVSQNQKIAVDYSTLGDEAFKARDFEKAESDFQAAMNFDPENDSYYSKLGDVYMTVAQNLHDVQERSLLFNQTLVTYLAGANNAENPQAREHFTNGAARVSLTLARTLAANGNLFDARQKLIDASQMNPTNPQIASQISELLKKYQIESIQRYNQSVRP